jgi:hypothetical protein
MVFTDGQQTCILALGAAVGLQTACIESGYLAEILRQLINDLLISLGLMQGSKRVDDQLAQLNGIISEAAFNFMVQLPSEIIDVLSERSLFSSDLM